MFCAKWSLFMGGFSVFIYTCAILYISTGLVGVHDLGKEASILNYEIDPDTIEDAFASLPDFKRKEVALYTFILVVEIVMLILSVLLIVGVKKQLHKLMAPWIYVSVLSGIGHVLHMFSGIASETEMISIFVKLLIAAAMWYPVFKHYLSIRNTKGQQQAEEASVEEALPCDPTAEFSHCGQQPATAPDHE